MPNFAHISIDGKLPSLNDLISANRKNPMNGARFKSNAQKKVIDAIHRAGYEGIERGDEPFKGSVSVNIYWCEPDRRRDYDNIESGIKYILDALVQEHVIPNDSQRYINGYQPIFHTHGMDRDNPHIDVIITDTEKRHAEEEVRVEGQASR